MNRHTFLEAKDKHAFVSTPATSQKGSSYFFFPFFSLLRFVPTQRKISLHLLPNRPKPRAAVG